MTTRRIVIVDDEPLARRRIRDLLEPHQDWQVIAERANGESAITACLAEEPDIVFLDVQLPDLSGLEVAAALLDALEPAQLPIVVFVTAHDEYAISAFEAAAVDYLLKPVGQERFDHAVARANRLLTLRDRAEQTGDEVKRMVDATASRPAAVFVARKGETVTLIRPDSVDWADAAGNYVRLHVGGVVHMVRSTFNSLVNRLDDARFLRIHRSAVVNLGQIANVRSTEHGEYVVTMADGTRLTASRTYSRGLREFVRQQSP